MEPNPLNQLGLDSIQNSLMMLDEIRTLAYVDATNSNQIACSNEQVNQNIAIISGQLGNHTSWELSALSEINENIFGLRGEVRDLTNAINSLLSVMRGTP